MQRWPRFIDFVVAFILNIGLQLKHPTDGRIAKKVLLATHGGLSLELCAVIENVCPITASF